MKSDQIIQNMPFVVIQTVNKNNSYIFTAIPSGWISENKTNVYWPPNNFDTLRKQSKSAFKSHWPTQNIHKVLLQGINTIAEADELVKFYYSRSKTLSESEKEQKKRFEIKERKKQNRTSKMNQYSLKSPVKTHSSPAVSFFDNNFFLKKKIHGCVKI